MRKAAVKTNKNINTNTHRLLAYDDDVDITGRTLREVIAVFSKIEKESAKVGLFEDSTGIEMIGEILINL